MKTFIFFAFAACLAIVICSPLDLFKSRLTEKNGGNKASQHHHHHLNLTKEVKNSLRQAWNEKTPEAQKACEANKPIREDYKKFREGLKNLTEEEQDAKIQARWDSLSKEEQVCSFHKREQRKEKRGHHKESKEKRHHHPDRRETVEKSGNKPAEKTGKKQVNKTQ